MFKLHHARPSSALQAYKTKYHDFGRGNVKVHVPDGASNSTPVVLLVHGYSDDADNFIDTFGLQDEIDGHEFYQIIPNGRKDAQGYQFWSAVSSKCVGFWL